MKSPMKSWLNVRNAVAALLVAGLLLLGVFAVVESRTESPLVRIDIFRGRAFLVDNGVLFFSNISFIPAFFFASTYGQIALGQKATESSLLILYFFLGFVTFAQIGGRMLDRTGAKRPVVLGCVLASVGYFLWAGQVSTLKAGSQVIYIIMAGAGLGLMLGQANTDAVNRASRLSYGEATGITQTVRNYGASLGFAILGTVLISVFRSNIYNSLVAKGVPSAAAAAQAASDAQLQGGGSSSGGTGVASIPQFIRADYASATEAVLTGMGVIMAVAAAAALAGLKRGVQTQQPDAPADAAADRAPVT